MDIFLVELSLLIDDEIQLELLHNIHTIQHMLKMCMTARISLLAGLFYAEELVIGNPFNWMRNSKDENCKKSITNISWTQVHTRCVHA